MSNEKIIIIFIYCMIKFYLTFLLMLTTLLAQLTDLSSLSDLCLYPQTGYDQFLNRCNKTYDPNEKQQRQQIFWSNCTSINNMNNSGISYQVGINCLSDFLMTQILNPIPYPPTANAGSLPSNIVTTLVNSVGLSVASTVYTNWQAKGMLTPVKNQGSCGCCWSFSTTSCYESAFMRTKNMTLDLSQEWVLECTDVFNTSNTPKSSCQGGVVDYALPLIVANGMPTESAYPYMGRSFNGVGKPSTISNCFAANTTFNILKYANNSNAQWFRFDNATSSQIQSLLLTGTLVILYYADSGFMSYTSGVYSCSVNFTQAYGLINHAMELVGMDTNGNYIVKNSWGTTWGVNGFATINPSASCALNGYVYQLLADNYYCSSLVLLSILIALISA